MVVASRAFGLNIVVATAIRFWKDDMGDTCTWSLGPNGTFTVKDARYRIDQNILPTLAHATTWDKSIPRKVNVFMWRLSLDRLPHRLNLSSRGMDIPAISCPSCNANVESANHVFFECDIATDMWKLVFRWCDIPLFQASSWDSFNDWIISWHASKEKKHRFYVITTSVLWWLWRYRNSITFNSQPLRKSDLFDNVRFSSFSWLHNRDHMKLSWNDWLMYPLSITRNGKGHVIVAQGYNQQEGIDYDETYALVSRLESIRILLAYVCVLDFKLFQMDVKSTFLDGFINEEVYVAQPSGFINSKDLNENLQRASAEQKLKCSNELINSSGLSKISQ
ncbi:RNA-directed DNA polymerase, eukaryota [Tanacetum coccineum]